MVFKMAEEKMMSKFPFSMENFPRHQSSFACLSLKFGSVISALIAILYSVFAIAQCAAALAVIPSQEQGEFATMVLFGLVIVVTITHAVTFVFSALMLVGVVADKAQLMRPWIIWISIQVTVCLLLFVFWSTMNMINHFADASLLTYVLEFLTQLIRFYMLMVVASYYKQLEEEKGESEKLMKIMHSDTWYNV